MSNIFTPDIQPKSTREPIPPVRYLILTLVILIAGWLIPQVVLGNRMALAVFVVPFVVLFAFLLIRQPRIYFPLLVLGSLIVPFSITTGAQSGINISILLSTVFIGLWLLEKIAVLKSHQFLPEPMIVPLLLLPVVSIISFGFGQIDWFPIDAVPLTAQLGGLAIFLLTPGVILVTAHRLRDLRSLQLSSIIFLGLGGLFVMTLLVPSMERYGRQIFQRAVYDSMFWAWLAAIAFSQSWLNTKISLWKRILLGFVLVGVFNFTIFERQAWISGWLPAAVAILTIVALKKPKLAFVGGVIVVLLFLIREGVFGSIFLTGDNVYSLTTRWEAWRIMLEIIKLNPILGLGPAAYYGYTPMFRILGYNVSFSSHNNYVDIIAQIGLVGLGCVIWFMWELWKSIWEKRDSVPEGFPRAYMYGSLGGLAALSVSGMLGDWFLPFVYNIGLEGFRASSLAWMFLGSAVALYYVYHPHEDSENESV